MKKLICLLSVFLAFISANAQFGSQTVISNSTSNPQVIKTADIDGDGDLDVIAHSDSTLSWFENIGSGIIDTTQNIIDFVFLFGINAADIDGDGNVDIISRLWPKQLVWYRNLGNGTFAPRTVISNTCEGGANTLKIIDMDNDLDLDIIFPADSFPYMYDAIGWVENNGSGLFGPVNFISFSLYQGPSSVFPSDIDGDGDIDVVVADVIDNSITLLEDTGAGSFDYPQVISYFVNQPIFLDIDDIDGDGNLDVISADWTENEVSWFKNLGGATFGPEQIILATGIEEPFSVDAADIDGDGDPDVLTAFSYASKITWNENLGGGNFGPQQIIDTNVMLANYISTSDADGDGDLDVFFSSYGENKIGYYENFFNSPFQLKGSVFYDKNQDGFLDSNEIGLPTNQILIQPNFVYAYSNNQGNYQIVTDTGTYTVYFNSNALWNLTTDSATYTRTLTAVTPVVDSLDFGFYPDTLLTLIEPILTGAFPRCNGIINYWIDVKNLGTTLPSGIIHLQLDTPIAYISSSIVPDSILGKNIYWHYDSLLFFSSEMINILVQMPSFTSMGDTLTSVLTVHELDGSNNIVYSNSDTLDQISVCGYDPNDKSVTPKGIGPEGYIAENPELEYLIRFQNTGNDTALTVMIRDQLDDNLDWSTLQPIASSHNMQVYIEQDGEVVFRFENIMLPDSNVNEPASHGFVKFSIKSKTGLLPNTPIFNTGHIYFDLNPAVITNTVLNTVDTVGGAVSVKEITFTESKEVIVFPNPFKHQITIYYKEKIEEEYDLSLFDITGKEVFKKENIAKNKTTVDLSNLNDGMYIIVGTDKSGKRLFSERVIAQ